jgi:hypothetical protein
MKHLFLYLILYFLLAIPKLYSQELPFTISAAFGSSFPVGKFEQSPSDNPSRQSAAEPGIAATAALSYQFRHSHFGVLLIGGWQQHTVDGAAIAKTIMAVSPAEQIYAGSNSWHIWKLMVSAGGVLLLYEYH